MKWVTGILTVLVLAMAFSVSAAAQTGAQTESRPLTLDDALELARTQSMQVRQGRVGVERARLSVDEARAGRLPSLSADGQYINNVRTPFIVLPADSPFGEQILRTGSRHNFSTSVQASVPIYNAQLNRSIELSRAVAALEEVLQEATIREVELEVQRAFVNGLTSREAHQVLLSSHETLERNLELIAALHEEGLVPEYDLVRTEVQVRNLEPELARARNNHDGAVNYIKLISGIPMEEEIVCKAPSRSSTVVYPVRLMT